MGPNPMQQGIQQASQHGVGLTDTPPPAPVGPPPATLPQASQQVPGLNIDPATLQAFLKGLNR